MKITQKISLDLSTRGSRQVIPVKQDDSMTRELEISLLKDGEAWTVPTDVSILRICYAKPDRTGGCYDSLPDQTVACTKSGSTVLARLHPQMFTCPGTVACELQLLTARQDKISTFTWLLQVEESPLHDIVSEDYYNLTPMTQIGDLTELETEAKANLVAAVNELHRLAAELQQSLESDHQGMIRRINAKTADGQGSVVLGSGDIQTESGVSLSEAMERLLETIPTDDEINAMILGMMGTYVKSVNGLPPAQNGDVSLSSDDLMMIDGEYGWAGYNVTQAIDEVMANIPTTQKLNSLIDARLALIPFAEEVVFNA